jgi:hypothetical protein
MRSLISWYGELSPWFRFGVAGLFLLASAVLLFFGIVWIWGWAIGAVLLFFALPSKAQRRGYHDF